MKNIAIILLIINLSACGVTGSGAPVPDIFNDGFYITIDSDHQQREVAQFITAQWNTTIECMNTDIESNGIHVHIVDSNRVHENAIGLFVAPDYIKVIAADIDREGSALRHEFEHYIKYHVYGDIDADHSNFVGC